MDRDFVVAITGASGACYAKRLVEKLVAGQENVHLIVSAHGRRLFADELDIQNVSAETLIGGPSHRLVVYSYDDLGSKPASGSFLTSGMVICPASSNTLASVASGLGDNLISRAAQVTLKESRRLIVVPREMPVSQIGLENLVRISRAGGIICPAMPGFYLLPKSIDELVDFVVGKILDLLDVGHDLNIRWQGPARLDRSG